LTRSQRFISLSSWDRRPLEDCLTRSPAILSAVAALMGAAGVGLVAAAVHKNGGDLARTAALFLIMHAAACLAVAAHARHLASRALIVTGFVLAAGAALFAADLAASAFLGGRLFPMAAPIGGTTMLLAWLALAVIFVNGLRR
jgi:uncharacterized membrane protein YgdD (TMEM256/DUF423 family)